MTNKMIMNIKGFEFPSISKARAKSLAKQLADYFGYSDLRLLLLFIEDAAEDEVWIPSVYTVIQDGWIFYRKGRLYRALKRPAYHTDLILYCRSHGIRRLDEALVHARHRAYRHMARSIERAIAQGYQSVEGLMTLEEYFPNKEEEE